MKAESPAPNRRILIVDDSPAIHDDFKKILVRCNPAGSDLESAEASLFGPSEARGGDEQDFELSSAFQGEEALAMVRAAVKAGHSFAMAFVDVRMPPGWDGIETIVQLWRVDPDLQIILCTAYSDYSWKELCARIGATDQMVILKKPFDAIEVLQLANALAKKWSLLQQTRSKVQDLECAISERTRALQTSNEQLRGAQEKLRHFLSKSPAVLYSLKFEAGRLTPSWISDNFADFTGCKIQDWYQQTPEGNCVEESDRSMVADSLKTLLAQNHVSLQYRIRRADNTVRWVRDDFQLLRDDARQPVEIIGCWTDITERKQLEEQLRQSQKMEAFGQLAGGVAHDFNNLLTIIKGYVCVLLDEDCPAEKHAPGLNAIAKATDRAAQLTRQLLAFSRRQLFQPRPLDLNEVVVGAGQMLQQLVGESITLKTQYLSAKVSITADPNMLEQVLINLAANARDAMPHGGQLTLATARCDIDSAQSRQHPEARPGPHVCLSVTDTGCGIAAEHMPRLFEPFFTTKDVGKGTGLGLASVYGIVKQHEGWIEVSSRVGKGTSFKIFFPASSLPVVPVESPPPVRPARGGGETILIVEDEAGLRELFCLSLQQLGYRVFAEGSGANALRAWSARLDQIDLLLTDLVMPDGVSGWKLASALQAEKPDLKAIYMSGHSADVNGLVSGATQNIRFLAKPFSVETLADTVRTCLDEAKQFIKGNAKARPVLQT
ncbi:MAG TPA: response regulator [Verrucomicrobiae bacterium]|nr:response regulator [Verrucomicrobiae bacterium]